MIQQRESGFKENVCPGGQKNISLIPQSKPRYPPFNPSQHLCLYSTLPACFIQVHFCSISLICFSFVGYQRVHFSLVKLLKSIDFIRYQVNVPVSQPIDILDCKDQSLRQFKYPLKVVQNLARCNALHLMYKRSIDWNEYVTIIFSLEHS